MLRLKRYGNRLLRPFIGPIYQRLESYETRLAGLESYLQVLIGMMEARPRVTPDVVPAKPDAQPTAEADTALPSRCSPSSNPSPEQGPADVLGHLVCPTCRTAIHVVPHVVTEDGTIKAGHIPCATCVRTVGTVHDFKFDFHAPAEPAPGSGPPRVIPVPGELRIAARDPRLVVHGDWWYDERGFRATRGTLSDHIEYRGRFTDAVVRLLTYPRCGLVDVFLDGSLTATADLYNDGWFVMPLRLPADLPFEEHTISIRPRGTRNPAAGGTEALVEELVLYGPRSDPDFAGPRPLVRTNPYSDVIERYIAAVPADGLILEAGGGDRRRLRLGYVNFEYQPFELADFYGDMQRLPFADDTFSLVFSQAVFEHVANPFEAAAELIRVTRPGGTILTEAAFMQPLHGAPHHYFNLTPSGAEELFKSCTIIESDWYDSLGFTVEWMLKSVGLHDKVPAERLDRVVNEIRELEALASHQELRAAAACVYVVARKPE